MRLMLAALSATFCLLAFGQFASADECKNDQGHIMTDPAEFQAEIEKQTDCLPAKRLAEACAWGSNLDVSTAGLAYGICEKNLSDAKPKKSDLRLLAKMKDRCTARYINEEGSLYRSMNAFCHLNALTWIFDLVQEQ